MGNDDLPAKDDKGAALLEAMLERLARRKHDASEDLHTVVERAKDVAAMATRVILAFYAMGSVIVAGTIWVWTLKMDVIQNSQRIIEMRTNLETQEKRVNQIEKDLINKVNRKPE